MPDGDKVYSGLGRNFHNINMQICDDILSPEEIAHNMLDVMKRLLRQYGEHPLCLIQKVAKLLDTLPSGPLLKPTTNWKEIYFTVERMEWEIARGASPQNKINKRAMSLAANTCKEQILTIQHNPTPADIEIRMIYRYMLNIYEAEFENPMRQGRHRNGASCQLVNERLQAIRPHVERGLRQFARQVSKQGNWKRLHRPYKRNVPRIGLHDDLLSRGALA